MSHEGSRRRCIEQSKEIAIVGSCISRCDFMLSAVHECWIRRYSIRQVMHTAGNNNESFPHSRLASTATHSALYYFHAAFLNTYCTARTFIFVPFKVLHKFWSDVFLSTCINILLLHFIKFFKIFSFLFFIASLN